MNAFTDIPQGDWKRRLPSRLVAYIELARLDRPTGIWLLLLPCFWGLALAGGADLRLYGLFAAGAVVMRGAGCTVNDILDRRIDAEVERTRGRPLPSGRVGVREALTFLALQLALGLLVLTQLNLRSFELGCASLVLVGLYPLMKRVTWWPQLFLGLTFNWGVLMGWFAASGRPGLPPLLLYGAGVAWTLAYDTIYAHQDKIDDSRIGVRSTARRFGAAAKLPVAVFYGLFLGLACASCALMARAPACYGVLAVSGGACVVLVVCWRPDEPANCLRAFKANRWIGLGVLAAVIAGGCSPLWLARPG